jgi:hypothetical protein
MGKGAREEMKDTGSGGLCFRCEHRAQYLEQRGRPRYECGEIEQSKYGCYMYKPVIPVILKPSDNDPRPQFGPTMITSRSYFAGIAEGKLAVVRRGENSILHWVFEEE